MYVPYFITYLRPRQGSQEALGGGEEARIMRLLSWIGAQKILAAKLIECGNKKNGA